MALIAKYTSNISGAFPTFNNGFVYTHEEVNNDGVYSISITSDNTPTKIIFNEASWLLSVEYLDTSSVTSMSAMFYNCTALTSLDLSGWDTSSVTTMSSMFRSCTALTSLDLSGLDTSSVTNMSYMFYSCNALRSLDLSGWDTSSVTSMSGMFQDCKTLTSLDLSGLDTSSVISMPEMFRNCTALTSLDLSGLDTSSVTNMSSMFFSCNALRSLDLSGWDTNSINILIPKIPTKSINTRGNLFISDDVDINVVDIQAATDKYWDIIVITESVDKNVILNVYHKNRLILRIKVGESGEIKNVYQYKLPNIE